MSAEVFTYTTRVVDVDGSPFWATTQVNAGKPGVAFRSKADDVSFFVQVSEDLIFPLIKVCADGLLRVLACGASGATYLISDATDSQKQVVILPGRRGGGWYAFGAWDMVLLQDDNSGRMSAWSYTGERLADDSGPLSVAVPYSAEGFWTTGPDGIPQQMPRVSKTVSGVPLGNIEEAGDWTVGSAAVGLLGGVVLVNRVTGVATMWPIYSPIQPALAVIDGKPYVSLSCGTHYTPVCPEPDKFPDTPYDPLPSTTVDGERRPLRMAALRGGGPQAPGHMHWSYTDGTKPHIEGGPDAWRDFFAGHPATVVVGSYSTHVQKECEELTPWPSDWPAPPESEVKKRDDSGAIWVGSMLELAQRSGAVLDCYRDENRVATDPADQNPDINVPEIRYPELEYVQSLRDRGVDAVIGHQGYPVMEHGVCLSAMDAKYRTETWGLQIYQAKNIPVALYIPIFTGVNDAYPMAEISRLFHFQTWLGDQYPCVRFVFGFAWDRHGGRDVHPWLGTAWTQRVAQTAEPADRLPVVRAWAPPQPVEPATPPAQPVEAPVAVHPPSGGQHDHTTAIVTATALSASVAAVALAIALKRKAASQRLTDVEQAMIADAEQRMRERADMAKGAGQ